MTPSDRPAEQEPSIMGMHPQVVTAAEAAGLVRSGVTVAGDGFGMMGVADEVYAALEDRFLRTGEPNGITLVHTSGQSNSFAGISRFAHRGLLSRVVGAHWGRTPKLSELIVGDVVEGICLPQGQLAALYQAVAAGRTGVLSTVGLGTFVDPRQEGGRVNALARRNVPADRYVQVVEIDGQEQLLYRAHPIDVGIIRGTEIDDRGNLSQTEEAAGLDSLSLAQAVRNSGGIVIAQAKRKVAAGTIPAREVVVPGALIDHVVITQDPAAYHRQANDFEFDERLISSRDATRSARGLRAGGAGVAEERLRIGRLAATLIRPGDMINAGTGIPGDTIGIALAESGLLDEVTMTMESGVIGGISVGGMDFGAAYYPEAIINQAKQFDFYNGCGVDVALMGVGQVSGSGDVNVSKFSGRVTGVGGFLDIVHHASTVVFLVSSSAPERKFVTEVDHVTFNGRLALAKDQRVFLVTDGLVLRLTRDGWQLQESRVSERQTADWLARLPFPVAVHPRQ